MSFADTVAGLRVVFDLTTLARWDPPPVGITRVERELGAWLKAHCPAAEFSFFSPGDGAFFRLKRRAAEKLLAGDGGVLWDMPRAGRGAAARTLDSMLRWLRLRRLAVSALERLRPPANEITRARVERLQAKLMSDAEQRRVHPRGGARRDLAEPRAMLDERITFDAGTLFICAGAGWTLHGLDAVAAAIKAGARLVVLCHDLIPLQFPDDWSPRDVAALGDYFAFVLAHAHLVVFTSRAVRRDAAALFPADAARLMAMPVAPLGADPVAARDMADPVAGLEPGRYALLVGTIEPRKGHALVLACWRRLLSEGVPQARGFRLVFAGRAGWQMDELVAALREGTAGADVDFIEAPDDAMLARLYAGAAFCLVPSKYEGYGLPVIEAFAHGKPVLASNRGALPEVVRGFSPCIAPDRPGEWLAWMRAWILAPESYASYADRIRDMVRHPSWNAAATGFFDAIALSLRDAGITGRHA